MKQSDTEMGVSTAQGTGRLVATIHGALKESENVLIEAPTGLGKTHAIATTAWRTKPYLTGAEPVIHVSPTRKTRDHAYQLSQDADGVTPYILKGREETCPVAAGKFDSTLSVPGENCTPSEWFNRKCDAEKILFSTAHDELEQRCGSLPCASDGGCHAVSQWHTVFQSDTPEYDVLHVTQNFVYNTQLVRNANLIFDEQPDFTLEVKKSINHTSQIGRVTTQEKIRQAVTDILSQCSGSNHTWESLLTAIQSRDLRLIEEYRAQLSKVELDVTWSFSRDDVHALAPAIIQALLNSEDVGNGRRRGVGRYDPSKLGFGVDGATEVIVVFDKKNNIKLIHHPPDLSDTCCVIGLDAHPTPTLWELQTGSMMERKRLLDPLENIYWRKFERKLIIYQVDEHTRPYTQGWPGSTPKEQARAKQRVTALIRAIRRKHGDDFRTCITPKNLRSDVEAIMKEIGIPNPEVLHYGGVKSRDDFKSESVGLLIGCIDPGDYNILDTVALLGLSAEAEMETKDDGTEARAPGRGFVGPNAKEANEILQSVRERNVAQAIGRYARDIHDTDSQSSGAVIYVWTDAFPGTMVDSIVPGVKKIPIGKEKIIIELVQGSGRQMTAKEVVEELAERGTEVSKTHVQNTLNELFKQGNASRDSGGYNGAYQYSIAPDAVTDFVDLDPAS